MRHALLILALAAPLATDLLPARADEPAQAAPRARARRRPAPPAVTVSFPGFRMNPDGTSRCFLRLSAPVEFTQSQSGRRLVVLLPGAGVTARNHLNPLETRFFNTPMVRAKLERRGRSDLALVVDFRADVTPTVRLDAAPDGQGSLLVVDLPAGQYVDGTPAIGGGTVTPSEDARSTAGGSGVGTDEERPPSFR